MHSLSAENFLCSLKKDAARDKAFFIFDESVDHGKTAREFISFILDKEPDKQWRRELAGKKMSQAYLAELFEKNLFEDLSDKIDPEDQRLLNSCIIGVVPLHGINGHAYGCDNFGNTLDRPLLVINYGVYFVCSFLANALTFEILEGASAGYKRSGKDSFHIAQYYHRLMRPPEDLGAKIKLSGLPIDIAKEVTLCTGRLTAIMMWFVALHEFAHIRHGDIERNLWKSLYSGGELAEPGSDQAELFEQEEMADKYAIERIGAWEDKNSNAWSNFAQVYLFMKFLEVMEEQRPIATMTHPPARRRKEIILAHATSLARHAPPYDYASFLEDLVDSWQNEIQEE